MVVRCGYPSVQNMHDVVMRLSRSNEETVRCVAHVKHLLRGSRVLSVGLQLMLVHDEHHSSYFVRSFIKIANPRFSHNDSVPHEMKRQLVVPSNVH